MTTRRFTALLALTLLCLTFGLAGCDGRENLSPEDLEKLFRENPDLVFKALENDPERVLALVEKGARERNMRGTRMLWDQQWNKPRNPAIDPDHPIRGPKDAPVTIVEYSDFQCPYCIKASATIKKLLEDYKGKVRLVFKHYPLRSHPMALPAAQYFIAAAMQDEAKAWELHDAMFANPEQVRNGGKEWIYSAAAALGLDTEKLLEDTLSDAVRERINADATELQNYGIKGTPFFLINGIAIRGAAPYEEFVELIERVLKNPPKQTPAENGPDVAVQAEDDEVCIDCGEEPEAVN